MEAMEALTTRVSALQLADPAPSDADLDAVLRGALRAPDHGKLSPWRFILVRGPARELLGRVMAESLRAREPNAVPAQVEAEAGKPLRAPLIITVVARVDPDHPKIPEIEQVISAGCAAQNIMLGFHALGFGCMWKTGGAAYDEGVKAALGLAPGDHIVGFLYVGTLAGEPKEPRALDPADFTETWDAPRVADA